MENLELIKQFKNILQVFRIPGEYAGYEEIKMGHINATYHVMTALKDGTKKNYIVQKINTYVFKNPFCVMNNIDQVTTHLRKKNPDITLHFHHTEDGKNYYEDGDAFWRLYTYKFGNVVDPITNKDQMEDCGRAFGKFQKELSDFDPSHLGVVIPDFHNTKKYLEKLEDAKEVNFENRIKEVEDELKFINDVTPYTLKIANLKEKDGFPLRVTHNDTKTNNVLFQTEGKPAVVIDLDTVMLGVIMDDFGDSIRYGANKAKEDEADLSKVGINMEYYEAYVKGFVGEVKDVLTPNEIECLAYGALTMTYEVGVRFITDYLNGDKYFRVAYPTHNLVRGKCQLALVKDMIAHIDEMVAIVKKYAC